MIRESRKILDLNLPMLSKPKKLRTAMLISFFLGPIVLSIYLKSWFDFFLTYSLYGILVFFCIKQNSHIFEDVYGYILMFSINSLLALFSYFRVKHSNEKFEAANS
jgi:hypothetical protein